MAKYQKYVEYKDSGVRWLGAVPSHWIIAGFKKYLESTVDYRGKTPEKMDEGVFLVTARNIKNGIIDYSLSQEYVAFKDYDEIMSRGIPVLGDVLFTTEAPLGEVAQIDNVNIALAQRIIKFRGKKDILDNTYLKYFILSQEFQDSLMTFATGSTALGIKAERIGYLQQCIPPIHEQTQIANFLDHETAKIDYLIEKQQQLIELLKEKRQAVISHAVTKGLNPNVPMKDSGVEWLGEVPEHWNMAPVRRYLVEHRQGYYTTESYVDEGLKLLRITDLRDLGEINISNCPMVNESDTTHLFKLQKGDVVFARTGGAGSFGVITEDYENLIYASYLIRFRFMNKIFEPDYLRFLFQSDSFQLSVKQNIHGGVNQNIHAEDIKNTVICAPSLSEQKEIIEYLENQCLLFENLIYKASYSVKLMQERRTALISSAVTGKIDVRNWQAPTLAEADTELSA